MVCSIHQVWYNHLLSRLSLQEFLICPVGTVTWVCRLFINIYFIVNNNISCISLWMNLCDILYYWTYHVYDLLLNHRQLLFHVWILPHNILMKLLFTYIFQLTSVYTLLLCTWHLSSTSSQLKL